jgi:dynein heavy chain 1
MKYIWRSETTINKYAHKQLATAVIDFEDGVNQVMQKTNLVSALKEELLECEPLQEEFKARLSKIQRIVTELAFNECSNLEEWVRKLNDEIEDILMIRLKDLLKTWVTEFSNTPDELEADHKMKHKVIVAGGEVINFVMDIQIVNQESIMLDPSLEEARAYWYKALHDQVEIICGLPRISSKIYERAASATNAAEGENSDTFTFKSLLGKMGYDEEGAEVQGEFNIK